MRGIYEIGIERPEGGALVYVGQAEVIERRQREHLRRLHSGKHDNIHLQRAFDKYGLNPDGWFRVLELVPEGEDLTPREQFWIDTRIAERGRERVMNQARASNTAFSDPEVIARRNANPQWRANNAAAMRDKSPEWRANNLAANVAMRAKHYVFTSPDGERVEVYNLAAFCREHGLYKSNMTKVALGKINHYKGWKRAE